MILEVFSNLNVSVILRLTTLGWQRRGKEARYFIAAILID